MYQTRVCPTRRLNLQQNLPSKTITCLLIICSDTSSHKDTFHTNNKIIINANVSVFVTSLLPNGWTDFDVI